ncbi:MAG: FGGY-family carbohydrate kinase, partial [Flavobacteriales bacterium]|nr:FGGY-family carbohydrate kinase [Flavobacteriales bacterium]
IKRNVLITCRGIRTWLKGRLTYALEGSVFIGGATIQWLRDNLGIINDAAETDEIASSIEKERSVWFVPAFAGLGAPHWDMNARGTITGLTRDTTAKDIIRASLDSIALQSKDVLDAMCQSEHIEIDALMVDGGASMNEYLMQFQSDVLEMEVVRPRISESTALGAALLAGIEMGVWDLNDAVSLNAPEKIYTPKMDAASRKSILNDWNKAIEKSKGWTQEREQKN